MENKKVKNASECIIDNIKFKSNLEGDVYSILRNAGFNPEYEKKTFTIWEGKSLTVPCYDQYKSKKLKRKVWGLNPYKPISIKYKPDFTFSILTSSGAEKMVVVEAKGYPNDRYNYVKKMFRSYLEKYHPESIFFEVHNKKQTLEAVKIMKSL